jgi:hypothetical protein
MRKQQTTSTFSATTLRSTRRRVLLGIACAMLSIAASAQTYPNFTAGGKTDLRTDASPSITPLYLPHAPGTVFTWKSAMAYRDSTTGNVAVSLSTDGITWSSPVDTGVATDEPIVAGNAQSGLYILVYTGGGYQYITSADGVTFTPPQPVALSIGGRTLRPHFQPGLTGYDTALYLSVVDTTPGSPDAVDVLVSNDDGQSFSSISWLSDIPTRSGSYLTVFVLPGTRFEALALAYTTGPEHGSTSLKTKGNPIALRPPLTPRSEWPAHPSSSSLSLPAQTTIWICTSSGVPWARRAICWQWTGRRRRTFSRHSLSRRNRTTGDSAIRRR